MHVDIICQRYLNSLLLTFFADGNHHTLQKGVFATSFFTEYCVRFIKYMIWNGPLSEREREREEEEGEEGGGREKERAKEREEEERKGILPFGNGCGSGAH